MTKNRGKKPATSHVHKTVYEPYQSQQRVGLRPRCMQTRVSMQDRGTGSACLRIVLPFTPCFSLVLSLSSRNVSDLTKISSLHLLVLVCIFQRSCHSESNVRAHVSMHTHENPSWGSRAFYNAYSSWGPICDGRTTCPFSPGRLPLFPVHVCVCVFCVCALPCKFVVRCMQN